VDIWNGTLEMLGMKLFSEIYKDRRVLVTGHTGFKGSWLTLWLNEMGAKVTGISLPTEPHLNHWKRLKLQINDYRYDVRNYDAIKGCVTEARPEIVFHLAAQPLVRRSYIDPLETWSTNVMGTANMLEACRNQTSVNAIVIVTTDKCYENKELTRGYREGDRLGGHDPYSSSKASAELVTESYRKAFFNSESSLLLATARAGNVIGGGDWSEDRLIPDLMRALEIKQSLEIRSPQATRPWQHVLESLSGYLLLGQKLLSGDKVYADAWNFGPELEGNRTVYDVLCKFNNHFNNLRWHVTENPQPHEAKLLYLDSEKANKNLNWKSVWNIDDSIEQTAIWYRKLIENNELLSKQQLIHYIETAYKKGASWAH
jgi:CDP-glucose 4,6-dehydratase